MWPFRRSGGRAFALVHIAPQAVHSGITWHAEGAKPSLCATTRTPIERREGESAEDSLSRALTVAGEELTRTGAPALRSIAGSGRVERVFVALQCPWESGSVVTKKRLDESPFTYSHAVEQSLVEEGDEDAVEDDSVIYPHVAATLLNGYLTHEPYGKSARRAEIVVFFSRLTRATGEIVSTAMRRAFHANHDTQVAFGFAATVALQKLHPQLKDFLVLSITRAMVEVLSVKRGHLVDAAAGAEGTDALMGITHTPEEELKTSRQPGYVAPEPKAGSAAALTEARKEWVSSLIELLKGCAARHALPRTVFVIATEDASQALAEAINDSSLRQLWLSDEPVTIVPLSPKHLASAVSVTGTAEANVPLALLAVFAAQYKR